MTIGASRPTSPGETHPEREVEQRLEKKPKSERAWGRRSREVLSRSALHWGPGPETAVQKAAAGLKRVAEGKGVAGGPQERGSKGDARSWQNCSWETWQGRGVPTATPRLPEAGGRG